MAIPIQQARGIFTEASLGKYNEMVLPPAFFSSFFKPIKTTSKYVSVEVRRGTEKIAVDVLRGTTGRNNQFTRSTERRYMPPFFNEYFDATQLDFYDQIFGGNPNPTVDVISGLAINVADKLILLRNKIDRAKELMAAQVFETGIVTMQNGDNIDFRRKASSMVDVSSTPWDTSTTDIESHLISAGNFIRTDGKNTSKVMNLIMSSDVFIALKKSDYFKDNANYRNVQLIDINTPQVDSRGASYHGQIVAGSYIFNLWTYDEMYVNSNGDSERYTNSKYVYIVPVEGYEFVYAHAGIPAIISDNSNAEFPEFITQVASEYWVNNYIDKQRKSHTFELMSAPLPVPVTVDMIYTMQVLA